MWIKGTRSLSIVGPGLPDYIRWLRQRVGREPVLLNFAAACIVQDGKVLLQRRSDDGKWGLPGGAMELGESAEEAVLREVAEETGLQIRGTSRCLPFRRS